MEHNLIKLGYQISFLDVNYYNPGRSNWSLSSPQHIPERCLRSVFSDDFFDYKFTVLRDPVDRFVSAFNFKRGAIGWFVSFESFLGSMERKVARSGFVLNQFDNHFLPASLLVPEGSDVFMLEDGLMSVFKALEAKLGLKSIKEVESKNTGEYRNFIAKSKFRKVVKDKFVRASPKTRDLTPEQVQRIRHLYKEDYEQFFSSDEN